MPPAQNPLVQALRGVEAAAVNLERTMRAGGGGGGGGPGGPAGGAAAAAGAGAKKTGWASNVSKKAGAVGAMASLAFASRVWSKATQNPNTSWTDAALSTWARMSSGLSGADALKHAGIQAASQRAGGWMEMMARAGLDPKDAPGLARELLEHALPEEQRVVEARAQVGAAAISMEAERAKEVAGALLEIPDAIRAKTKEVAQDFRNTFQEAFDDVLKNMRPR